MKIRRILTALVLAVALALFSTSITFAVSPTNVTSSNANTSYSVNDVILIQVTFDSPVTVDTTGGTPRLALNSGATAYANYTSGTGNTTLTFTYTVGSGENSTDLDYTGTNALDPNGGTMQNGGVNVDLTLPLPGHQFSLGYNKDIIIDTTAPTVTDVTSSTTSGSFAAGQSIDIQVTFSEVVVKSGTPSLTLNSGGTAFYSSGSPSNILTFTYTVAAGNNSSHLDYSSTSSLTGTIMDGAGNSAVLTLPATGGPNSLAGHTNIIIDTTKPTVTSVNSTLANGTYKTGQLVPIQVNFSENVYVTGTPTLALATGNPASTPVNYSGTGSGTTQLNFNYTVATGNFSTDLDYVATSSLAGTITDLAGNAATLTLPTPGASGSLGANKAIVIDAVAPAVTGVTSSVADGSYKAGQVVPVQVVFSEVVNVTGTPTLTLSTGTPATTVVNYSGTGSGTTTLTFNYTVAAGNTSPDLDYAATNSLALNGGTIMDTALNNANLSLASPGAAGSLGANKAIVIDTTAPTVTNVTSSSANGTYKAGQIIPVQVVFSEAVNVTGTPTLTLATGTPATTPVNFSTGSGSTTLNFNYTVVAGNTSPDLDYVATSSLAGAIADLAGNAATLTLSAPGTAGSLGANKAIVIDTTAPTVTGVTSSLADGTYTTGQLIPIQVSFSENVYVTGIPTLTLATGTPPATAVNYGTGSGSTTLTFNYTVAAGNTSPDLDYSATNSLAGTIADLAGNAATLTLPAPGAAGSLGANKSIVISTDIPAVTGVTSSLANGSYKAGQVVPIQVTFSKIVYVTGTPTLTLATGTPATTAVSYSSGSPSTTLTFNYTVATGNTSADLDYSATSSLALNGGTIMDSALNNANLSLPLPGSAGSLGANKAIIIDTTAPTVTGVTSSLADGSYKAGQVIPVQVNFSEIVNVTGTPTLTLATGTPATTAVNFATGSGSTSLSFNYSVIAGNTSPDLDYSATNSLAGTIADPAGNVATLTLPLPGAAGSLGANKAIVIDTTAPTVTINQALGQLDPTNNPPINFTVVFSEAVTGFSSTGVTLGGTALPTTAVVTGSGTTYNVAVSGMTATGTVTASVAVGAAQDLAGNLNLASTSGDNTVNFDSTALTVTINQAAGQLDPTKTSPINFAVVFSKVTIDFLTGDVALSGTAGATTATVTGSGTTYNVAVSGMTMNGTVIASIAPGVAHDAANNANLASSSTDNTVTYDTIAPVFSAVAPAPSTFISSITGTTSAVSYTLSETVASGSITMTQTGGTADPGSPHTCALKGTALNSGSHNKLDLSDTINACTIAQSLVSGAVYTFAFNATDLAGNLAVPVTNTNITFDNTGPLFSAVAPATSAFIKSITGTTSAVSYTLSKDIASGSITMTWSGGLGDPGSPHLCTLKGTALLLGPHNNLDLSNTTNSCTVAQSLVSGAVYTFAFNGVDAAGNPAPTVTSTGVTFDSSFPILSWIAPVSSGLTYYVGNQTVQLAVNATDNVGVTQVVFSRWDAVNLVRVPIATLTSPTILPSTYNVSLDTSTLLPGYNEIDVKVEDGTGNTTQDYIWLYHLPVVTVTKSGRGTGTVTSNPPGINCGSTCSSGFSDNSTVTLTAVPTPPYTFDGWTGACVGTGTCTLTMNAAKSVTAIFSYWKIYLPLIQR